MTAPGGSLTADTAEHTPAGAEPDQPARRVFTRVTLIAAAIWVACFVALWLSFAVPGDERDAVLLGWWITDPLKIVVVIGAAPLLACLGGLAAWWWKTWGIGVALLAWLLVFPLAGLTWLGIAPAMLTVAYLDNWCFDPADCRDGWQSDVGEYESLSPFTMRRKPVVEYVVTLPDSPRSPTPPGPTSASPEPMPSLQTWAGRWEVGEVEAFTVDADHAVVVVDKAGPANRNVFAERLGEEWVYVSNLPSTGAVEAVDVDGGRIEVTFVRVDGSREHAVSTDGGMTWAADS